MKDGQTTEIQIITPKVTAFYFLKIILGGERFVIVQSLQRLRTGISFLKTTRSMNTNIPHTKCKLSLTQFNYTVNFTELFYSILFYSTALRCVFLATSGH